MNFYQARARSCFVEIVHTALQAFHMNDDEEIHHIVSDHTSLNHEEVELEDEGTQNTFLGPYFSPCSWVRHLKRGLTLNIGNDPIYTKQEKKFLEDAGVQGGNISFNFLTWRRSCLATTLIPVLLALIISVIENMIGISELTPIQHNGTNITDILKEIKRVEFIVSWVHDVLQLLSIIIVSVALWNWEKYLFSRKAIHFAWSIYFFGPFLIGCFPMIDFGSFRDKQLTEINIPIGNQSLTITIQQLKFFLYTITNQTAAVDQAIQSLHLAIQLLIGAYFATTFFFRVSTQSLSLPLALIRSALTVRGLLPTSTLNGNIIKLVTLLFVPLSWSWFLLLIQTSGNFVFLVSPVLYSFPAVIIVVFLGKYVIPPMPNLQAVTYATRIRYFYLICVVLSAFFLWLSFKELWSEYLKQFGKVLVLIIDFVGEYFLTAVFSADLVATFLAEDKLYNFNNTDTLKDQVDPVDQIKKLYEDWNY